MLENPSGAGLELHEPPAGLLTYPYDRIKTLIDSPDDALAAIEELAAAGWQREQIYVLCGAEGATRLDVTGRHHGLRGRVYRFMERFADDVGENLERSAAHLQAGGLWMTVPATDEDKEKVVEILARHGAHDLVHYGRGHHERLGT
ncbi:MAG: hypothetical protein ACRDKW_05160 [Actinomycetota bacterium]